MTRFGSETNANPNAALADGIKGFNLEKGEGCYLGIALSSKGKKEVLPQLSPEWEPALESDVSRAILRLSQSSSSGAATVAAPKSDVSDRRASQTGDSQFRSPFHSTKGAGSCAKPH